MTQPAQSDRQNPASASNGGGVSVNPMSAPSSISLAEMESLLRAARQNVANASRETLHEELGPGDVQYFRGESTTTPLNLEQAIPQGWFESPPPDELLQHAEHQLAQAMSVPAHEPLESLTAPPKATKSANNLSQAESARGGLSLEDLGNLELDISIELGRTELLIEDVLKLREGSVVSLDKLAGDPVDIIANGRLVARGELLVIDGKFGVRLSEVL